VKFKPEEWGDPALKDTHVSNVFIQRYLKDAPAEYVKVYLYFLMMYQQGEEGDFEKAVLDLGQSKQEVAQALAYWNRVGVIEFSLPEPEVRGTKGECSLEDQQLVEMFSLIERTMGRPLGGTEPMEIVSWLSDYGATPEMVVYAFAYSSKNKHNVSIKYIEAIVRDWTRRGLSRPEQIEEHLEKKEFFNQRHRRIFRALGFLRNPTEAEREMMDHWLEGLGIPMEEILEACRKTTGISNPNLNYINQVLMNRRENRHGEGKLSFGANGQNALEDVYSARREKGKKDAEERKGEVYRKVPLVRDLDQELARLHRGVTRLALEGSSREKEVLLAHLEKKKEERAYLLTKNGFPPDYTDIRYECKICKDTGKTREGAPCACQDVVKEVFET
jgi:DnaD/phage-associated family protein